jgi:uncharacterized protein (UPF0297 family)
LGNVAANTPLKPLPFFAIIKAGVKEGPHMSEPTTVFSIYEDKDGEIKQILTEVYDALKEKGYNPINQLVGYILSEDPTYITTYGGARNKIRKVDRDDLLSALLKNFLGE